MHRVVLDHHSCLIKIANITSLQITWSLSPCIVSKSARRLERRMGPLLRGRTRFLPKQLGNKAFPARGSRCYPSTNNTSVTLWYGCSDSGVGRIFGRVDAHGYSLDSLLALGLLGRPGTRSACARAWKTD